MTSITNRLQNSNKNVVHDNTHRTCKVCTKIYNGFRENIRRSPHQHQDLWRQKHSQNSQDRTGRKTKCNGCMDCLLQAVSFFGTVISGNNYTRTHGNTVNKTYHQENQVSRRTDCCQRIAAKIITYNQRIRCIVQLLKQIPQKQWNGKKNDLFRDTSLCHSQTLFHIYNYSFLFAPP